MTQTKPNQIEWLCFGRSAEQDEFIRWVEDQPASGASGRAALTLGPAGMGKTTLLRKFAELCRARGPESWYVQLESLNPNESPSSFLARLMENTHRLLQGKYLREGPDDKKILKGLLKATPAVGELLTLLVSDEKRPGWQRFIDYVDGVSKALAKTNDRFVLLIDPDRAMKEGQADEWLSIAKQLPPLIRVLIAQRPDDVIAMHSETKLRFAMIPSSGSLAELDEDSVNRMYEHEFKYGRLKSVASDWPAGIRNTLPTEAWKRCQGHPFAHDAMIRLLISRTTTDPIQEMATWPPALEALLDMLLESLSKQGADRVKTALALQVFAIPTPLAMWARAAGVTDAALSHALHDPRYAHFFTEVEKDVFAPFHALFAERLEQELQRLSDTRHTLAEAAWKALEPDLAPKTLATTIPNEFVLFAATQVGARFETTTRLVEAVDLVSEVKRRLGMLDACQADLRLLLDRHGEEDEELRAAVTSNQGYVLSMRGDLTGAEKLHKEALGIYERLHQREGVASQHGNLGIIQYRRGHLTDAASLLSKALEVYQNLHDPAGTAISYANLGMVFRKGKDLDRAEQLFTLALKIDRSIERLPGIAANLDHLGGIRIVREDIDGAEKLYREALDTNKRIGRVAGEANNYCNLGNVFWMRKDLHQAQLMYKEALGIYEKLEDRHRVAELLICLGNVERARGNSDGMKRLWTKSRDLHNEIGMSDMADAIQAALDELDGGQLDDAEPPSLRTPEEGTEDAGLPD